MYYLKLPASIISVCITISVLSMAYPESKIFAQTSLSASSNDLMVILTEKPNTKALLKLSDNLTLHKGELIGGVPNSNILVYSVGSDPKLAAETLQNDPGIKYAFPMPRVYIQKQVNDTYYPNQWPLQSTHVAGDSVSAWDLVPDLNATSGVKVAVVDTGVDRSHPDLAGKIDTNDWVICDYNHTPQCYENASGIDDNGHGTHIAGIIGANPDNSSGIAGVGWGTKILSIKALGADGSGTLMDVFLGAAYAIDHGVKIINFSLGATEASLGAQGVLAVQEEVENIWNQGGILVVAAGNCGDGADPSCGGVNPKMYPGASNHVISVGATTTTGALAPYSENGNWVTLVAPGGSCLQNTLQSECVLSTWSSNGVACPVTGSPSGYCHDQGTSMAAPQVSGIAALMLAKNPSLTNSQIVQILTSTANSSVVPGKSQFGGVDALTALSAVPVLPSITAVPTITTAVSNTPVPTLTGIPVTPSVTVTPSIFPTGILNPTDIPRKAKSQTDIPSGELCVHTCALSTQGDANCDGQVTASDADSWYRHFDTVLPGNTSLASGNFACVEGNISSNYIDLIDFEVWRRNTSEYVP